MAEPVIVEDLGRRTRMVVFRVEEELLREIDELARERGKSRSEVIREALRVYLALYEEEGPRPRLVKLW